MRSDSKGSTTISAQMLVEGKPRTLTGVGNGPIDAFVHALRGEFGVVFDVKDYVEHALSQGSEAMAVAYIEGADSEGNVRWGVLLPAKLSVRHIVFSLSISYLKPGRCCWSFIKLSFSFLFNFIFYWVFPHSALQY